MSALSWSTGRVGSPSSRQAMGPADEQQASGRRFPVVSAVRLSRRFEPHLFQTAAAKLACNFRRSQRVRTALNVMFRNSNANIGEGEVKAPAGG